MNVNCYNIEVFQCEVVLSTFLGHLKHMLMCNFVFRGICLSTFSHDAVRILASPESITGGAPNCKMEEFIGPYSRQRNNFSPGISLTMRT